MLTAEFDARLRAQAMEALSREPGVPDADRDQAMRFARRLWRAADVLAGTPSPRRKGVALAAVRRGYALRGEGR